MSARSKLLAGLCLTVVSTCNGVLLRVVQRSGHGFHFSTQSAIAIAEMVKFTMAVCFHTMDIAHHKDGVPRWKTALEMVKEEVSPSVGFHILLLASLYCINNQLGFALFTMVDPGSMYVCKACSTIIVATMQCVFLGRRFSADQWKAMTMQFLALIVVQYDSCKGTPTYGAKAYICLLIAVLISATAAARNEYLLKNYKVSFNVQNMVLYACGSILNVLMFLFVPNPNGAKAGIGFFDGYDDVLAIMVIVSNSILGIVINGVYKYADAVVKCISSDVTAVLLCVLSTMFFGMKSSLTTWCGVAIICVTVQMYAFAKPPPPAAPLVGATKNPGARFSTPSSTSPREGKGTNSRDGENGTDEELGELIGKHEDDHK